MWLLICQTRVYSSRNAAIIRGFMQNSAGKSNFPSSYSFAPIKPIVPTIFYSVQKFSGWILYARCTCMCRAQIKSLWQKCKSRPKSHLPHSFCMLSAMHLQSLLTTSPRHAHTSIQNPGYPLAFTKKVYVFFPERITLKLFNFPKACYKPAVFSQFKSAGK